MAIGPKRPLQEGLKTSGRLPTEIVNDKGRYRQVTRAVGDAPQADRVDIRLREILDL